MSIVPIPATISDFQDALGVALELSDEFAFAQAIVVLDHDNHCVDFAVFTDIGNGLDRSINWLSTRVGLFQQHRVLLFSVRSINGVILAEIDLAEYRLANTMIARMGAQLVDWIETDGEIVRSYSYLANPNSRWAIGAGAQGAVAERRCDRRRPRPKPRF